jgi:sporulation protein YlmC with PRC-barrel domain
VRGSDNRNIGKVEDLVVELQSGRLLYAVVSAGGFLGIGDRDVAVPPGALRASGDRFQLDADRQKLEQAPQYQKAADRQSEMNSPAFVRRAYQHFGETPWFEGISSEVATGQFGSVMRASELIGMSVNNVGDQKIADVNDLMIDIRSGRAAFVVLSPQSDLDLQHDFYAVPPMSMTVNADRKSLRTGVNKEKLSAAPGFDRNNWSNLASQAPRIYEIYGKDAFAAGSATAASGGSADVQSTQSSSSSRATAGQAERVNRIIGQNVRNANNDNIGEIKDVMVDLESGRLLYTVVSVGGFLGIGERLVAVPPETLRRSGNTFQMEADKEKLSNAPQFLDSSDRANEMLSPTFVSSAYKYFGESTWFEGGSSSAQFGSAFRASTLLGIDVKDTANQNLGEVDNLLIDLAAGRLAFIILNPDRSLNLRSERYALPPMALTPGADRSTLTLGIDRQRLTSAPGFAQNNWPDLSGERGSQVYEFYGKRPYTGGTLQPTSGRTNGAERIYHEPNSSN